MVQSTSSFESSVQLDFATGPVGGENLKPGEDILLVARFRDFVGEPTKDCGDLTITASKGTLLLPNGGDSGNEIRIEAGQAPIGETGEFPIIMKPSGEHGKTQIAISCKLGTAYLEVDIPKPAGFALAEVLESIIYAFLVAILIRIFFFQTFWIPSGSMEPTLYEGDRILANKLIYRLREPERGEVVIFRVFQPSRRGTPGRLTLEEAIVVSEERSEISRILARHTGDEETEPERRGVYVQDYIKRVVGLPGDVVEVRAGEIYVNGRLIQETYSTMPPNYDRYGPITVPPGEIFVLGDNRANSQDSHVIGTVPIRNLEGRAEAVFWPPKRIALIP